MAVLLFSGERSVPPEMGAKEGDSLVKGAESRVTVACSEHSR